MQRLPRPRKTAARFVKVHVAWSTRVRVYQQKQTMEKNVGHVFLHWGREIEGEGEGEIEVVTGKRWKFVTALGYV